jgi:hypothetical protein
MQQVTPNMSVWFVLIGLGILAVIAIAVVTIVALAMGKAKFNWLFGIAACLAVPAMLVALLFRVSIVRLNPEHNQPSAVLESMFDTDGRSIVVQASSRLETEASTASTTEAPPPDSSQPAASATLPDWTAQPETSSDGVRKLAMSSQRFVTQEEAENQLAGEVAKRVRLYFHEEFPDEAPWTLPADWAVRRTVKQRHVELIPTKFSDDMTVNMQRVHWQVELSPDLRRELQPLWREQVVKERLTRYGGGVGAVSLLLLMASVYNRVNASTHGAYRGWLRLAALALVAGGGTAALFIA